MKNSSPIALEALWKGEHLIFAPPGKGLFCGWKVYLDGPLSLGRAMGW